VSSDFWAKKIGGIATPRPQQPAPSSGGAWWQEPAPQQQYQGPQSPMPIGYPYGQPLYNNPALAAQMPGQQVPGSREQYVAQLMRIPADQLNQQQMEEIALFELESREKYNLNCPQCGSTNFAPQGTKLGTTTLGTDKCFDCGASSSAYVSSPEPARGGSKASKAPYREVRQIDTGGAVQSMYMKFNGVPAGYMPRGS
jgi:hypothetical protein